MVDVPCRNDSIEALDVIEPVSSQPTVLTVAHRMLGPGGVFWFTLPNRYYLYGPEQYVMLWGGGFVPRRWQNAYVKLRKGGPWLVSLVNRSAP